MMSTMSLSMMNNMSMWREQEEARARNSREVLKTQEDIDAEYEFRKKEIENINATFTRIKALIEPLNDTSTITPNLYKNLSRSIVEFEQTLISEVAIHAKGNTTPIETAEKFESTVNAALSTQNTLNEKNDAVIAFRNYARHAKYSETTKLAIGAVIGAVVTAALFVGLIVGTGGIGVFAGIGLLYGGGMGLLLSAYGACVGLRIAAESCKNQDDNRGRDVVNNLQTLITERNKLFQTQQHKLAEPKPAPTMIFKK